MNPFNKLDQISDASEWQQTQLPALSDMDLLQRCYICKEFLRAPVIAPCNHTFCSQCIREYLLAQNLCPLCKIELFESNLKRDVLLEEIVTCYGKIRPHLLRLLTQKKEPLLEPAKSVSPPQILNPRADESLEIVEVTLDNENVSDQERSHKKQKFNPSNSRSSSPAPLATIPHREELVLCPICGDSMSAHTLQTIHIDQCLSGKKASTKPNDFLSRKPVSSRLGITSFFQPVSGDSTPHSTHRGRDQPSVEILPDSLGHSEYYFNNTMQTNHDQKLSRLDYLSLTTSKLKEKLAAVKIPTGGSRMQLELRYNQYYVIYNSNLDSSRPVLERELRQKLSQWERAHLAFAPVTANLFNPSTRSTISKRLIADKNFLVLEWMGAYHGEFKRLIRAARRSAKAGLGHEKNQNISVAPEEKSNEPSPLTADKDLTARSTQGTQPSLQSEQA